MSSPIVLSPFVTAQPTTVARINLRIKIFNDIKYCDEVIFDLVKRNFKYDSWQEILSQLYYYLYNFDFENKVVETIASHFYAKILKAVRFNTAGLGRGVTTLTVDISEDVRFHVVNYKSRTGKTYIFTDNSLFAYKTVNKLVFKMNYTSNIYMNLPEEEIEDSKLDLEIESDEFTDIEFGFFSPIKRRHVVSPRLRRRDFISHSNLNYDVQMPYEETQRPRNATLLARLRAIINIYRMARLASSAFNKFLRMCKIRNPPHIEEMKVLYTKYATYRGVDGDLIPVYEPEMDDGSHGINNLGQNQASNVVLTESRIDDTEVAAPVAEVSWGNLCSTDIAPNYNMIVDRWIVLDNFEWNKDNTAGSLIKKYQLPHAIMNKVSRPCEMPNTLPFTIHRYWKGDLEVKIQINSNKFQIGTLQCSWLYCPDFDEHIDERMNIHSLSQAHHVLVSASASNEASLVIPYKYYLPYLHTKPRGDMSDPPLNLGTLYIYVLNPLSVNTGGPSSAYATIFIRFMNNEFTGMLSGDIDPIVTSPEMDNMLAGAIDVAGSLFSQFADRNRDNPPQIEPPKYLVPTASHSWAVGTGQSEPLHPLRLDGRGQVPHPPGIDVNSEMLVSSVTKIFGLLDTIEWSKDQHEGTVLWECDAAPLMNRNDYVSEPTIEENTLWKYRIPPVGVISSMFMGWRGTLEYRFDVVSTQFHTGRLMVAYVPGAQRNQRLTMNQMRASPNMVFTLQEDRQFSFMVPYVANKPVWPRMYAGDYDAMDAVAPSRLYLGVLNNLIPMQSVIDKVFINIYVRAGDDFELLVPVQPALGLSCNSKYVVNKVNPSTIIAVSGYAPYYSGAFEDLDHLQCFRWGTLSHQIAQFTGENSYDEGTKQVTYCALQVAQNSFTVWSGSASVPITYAVFVFVQQLGYVIGIPCQNKDDAYALAYNLFVLKKAVNDPSNNNMGFDSRLPTTSNTYCTGNPIWKILKQAIPTSRIQHQGERDMDGVVIQLGQLQTTGTGRYLYGESFHDLKDITRRYQLYGIGLLKNFLQENMEFVRMRIPILPQGLDLNYGTKNNVYEIFNRGREGHIPLIANGYRYYRGGIRFRLVISDNIDSVVYIQHRPDRRLETRTITFDTTFVTGEGVLNHTYASYLQLTKINNIIEFEVPFYLMGMYGLLQSPKISKREEVNFFSLGEIVVGLSGSFKNVEQRNNTLITVYYSMADDMSFSTFQGFSKMVFLTDIPSSDPPKKKDKRFAAQLGFDVVEPEGLTELLFPAKEVKEQISPVINEVVSEMLDKAKKETGEISASIGSSLESLCKEFAKNYQDSMLRIGLSVVHIISEPTIKNLAFSTVNILLELKIIFSENIMSALKVLCDLLRSWGSKVSTEPLEDTASVNVVEPEGWYSSFDSKDWISLVGLIFSGVSAFTGLVCKAPRNMSKLAAFVVTELPSSAKSGSFIVSFLTSVSELVKRIFKYIICKVYPVESWFYDIDDQIPDIKDWASEVLYLDSKDLSTILDTDGYYYDRIFAAYLYGQQLVSRYLEVKDSRISIILRIHEKIVKKYETMMSLGRHPFIRKEPFCLWVEGSPGIGKSFLMEFLTTKLLRSVKYKLRGPKTFTVMPAGEFWTGCKNQPVLNMDDAFSVEMGQTLERQLNMMYMVKSPVALNPPMAALEDKHLRYNPEIFYINSNKAFLNVAGVDPQAIHRRRDVLIRAQMKDASRPLANQYTSEELSNFSHLEFFIAVDVVNPKTAYDGPYSYIQLTEILCKKYRKFYNKEIANFKKRMDTYEDMLEEDEDEEVAQVFTLKEKTFNKHSQCVMAYKQSLETCWYSKFNRWKTELDAKYFNCTVKSKFLGSMYKSDRQDDAVAGPSTAQPEMEITLDEEAVEAYSALVVVDDTVLPIGEIEKKLKPLGKIDKYTNGFWHVMYLIFKFVHEHNREINELDRVLSKQFAEHLAGIMALYVSWFRKDIIPENIFFILYSRGEVLTSYFETTDTYDKLFIGTLDSSMLPHLYRQLIGEFTVPMNAVDLVLTHYLDNSRCPIDITQMEYDGKIISVKNMCMYILPCMNVNPNEHKNVIDLYGFDQYVHILRKAKLYFNIDNKQITKYCFHCCDNIQFKNGKFVVMDIGYDENKRCEPFCILDSHLISFYFHIWIIQKDRKLKKLYNAKKFDELPMYFSNAQFKKELESISFTFLSGLRTDIKRWIAKVIPDRVMTWLVTIGKLGVYITATVAILAGVGFLAHALFPDALARGVRMCSSIIAGRKVLSTTIQNLSNPAQYVVAENAYKIPSKVLVHPKINVSLKPQMAEDTSHLMRKLVRNSFMIVCEYVDTNKTLRVMKARCLGIQGNRVLAIRHYHDAFLAAPSDAVYYFEKLENGDKGNRIYLQYRELRTDAFILVDSQYETNYFILYMPPQIPLFKNIINIFPTVNEHRLSGREGMIMEYGKGIIHNVQFQPTGSFYIQKRGAMEPVSVEHGYSYNYRGFGVCGALLLSDNLRQSPVIGMHVAGGDTRGLAEPLYREMFLQLRPQEISDVEEMVDLEDLEKTTINIATTVLPEGVVSAEYAHVETGKTALEKSELYGVFPVLTEPNPLKKNDPRLPPGTSPIVAGCEKHGLPVKQIPPMVLQRATLDFQDLIISKVIPVRHTVGKMNLQDVICGNPGIPHCESLMWDTSPGYGFKKKGMSGKKWLFNLTETSAGYKLNSINERLSRVLQHKETLRASAIVPATVFVDCLKDTCLPVEKCKIIGKTRIFSISPVDFTIQFKQYFGDFLCAYTKARFEARHAIGINCDSLEWTDLAILMQRKGNKVIDIDYQNFGPGVALDVAYAVFSIIIEWYRYHGASDEYCKILRIFCHEIICAKHLCLNLLYTVFSGIPSGSPITAPLNSMINNIYLRIAWLDIFKDNSKFFSMEAFNVHVFEVTYGDDAMLNVSDEAIEFYNSNTICDAFSKYSIVCTDARKTGIMHPYTSLTEASFLSRQFIMHPTRAGIYLAALKKVSINSCLNWVRTKACDKRTASLINSRMAVELSFGWGPQYYSEIKQQIQRAWNERGERFVCKTWEERDSEIFDFNESFVLIPLPYF